MSTTHPCPKCETEMRKVRLDKMLEIAGLPFGVSVFGLECPKDKRWILEPAVHREIDRAAVEVIATEGPATGRTLRFMHGWLGLKGIELAPLLDLAPETLSRIEHEKAPLPPLAWAAVARMVLDRLHGRHETEQSLRTAKVKDRPSEPRRLKVA